MLKTKISISGMHCSSCELLISEELEKIPQIKKTKVRFRTGTAKLWHKKKLDLELISSSLKKIGYSLGQAPPKPWISKNSRDYKDLGIAILLLVILYLVLKNLGIFNINVGSVGKGSSLGIILLVGLTAGFSTCMALIGGLVLGVSAKFSEQNPDASALQKFKPHLAFNAGRIISFFLLGGLIGMLGNTFKLSNSMLGILTIGVGFVMLLLGLQLIQIFPRLNQFKLTLPSFFGKLLKIQDQKEKRYSHKNAFVLGSFTFFLPCGFTQAMQLLAISSGSFWQGGLIMTFFALGTAPGLLGIGGLTAVVKGIFAKRFFQFSGLVVVFLAFFNISNGFNLTGWNFSLFPKTSEVKSQENKAEIKDGAQILRMKQYSRGYSPNKFTIYKDIPVKWIIQSEDENSCAASLYSSKLGIRKILNAGENIIEFKPKTTGQIKFSCSMGMYRGEFTVLEDENLKKEIAKNSPDNGESDQSKNQDQKDQAEKSPEAGQNAQAADVQKFQATYTLDEDIQPNEFRVKVGYQVQIDIDVKEDGQGCMSSIMVPGLIDDFQILEQGIVTLAFTAQKEGSYEITCAMGAPRGVVYVEN